MPELPEVETIVRELKKVLISRKIINVEIKEPLLIGFPGNSVQFKEGIVGQKIINVSRRGKYIILVLSEEKRMIIHLRMSGKLLFKNSYDRYGKHTHIVFKLDNNKDLRFNTIRKFSRVYLIEDKCLENAGGFVNLGPEPLGDDFTLRDFKLLFKGRKAIIKSLLLNQKFLAGLGNIYTDEALFRAGIKPTRRADSLTDKELSKLYKAIRKVLAEGIKYGGTTFSDYVNAMGQKGDFQGELMVYQRGGEKCYNCGHKIIREKICGRSTHYCPGCQQ